LTKQIKLVTDNTGLNTQGIMGKMGNTWRGVEKITKTGETDQGVTVLDALDRRVKEKQPKCAQHMWELLQDCWKSIPGEAG
jgi:hypothetical protein